MTVSVVLTFIGRDRPGLVSAISACVAAAGGNWLESRLARLAGAFAGIVLVAVPEAGADALADALKGLEASGLRVTVERGVAGEPAAGGGAEINLVGHDRPGIVRDVTRILNELGANIEEFSSFVESAPFTGEKMFHAAARLTLPAGLVADDVRIKLECLAAELMVDLVAAPSP